MPHRVWVASESLDVFENPFVVAALFLDVFEQRGLVAPIIGACNAMLRGANNGAVHFTHGGRLGGENPDKVPWKRPCA